MNKKKSKLEQILSKAAYYSKKIDAHKKASESAKNEEISIEKNIKIENDLISLAKSLHDFQQKTISTLSDSYTKAKSKTDKGSERNKLNDFTQDLNIYSRRENSGIL